MPARESVAGPRGVCKCCCLSQESQQDRTHQVCCAGQPPSLNPPFRPRAQQQPSPACAAQSLITQGGGGRARARARARAIALSTQIVAILAMVDSAISDKCERMLVDNKTRGQTDRQYVLYWAALLGYTQPGRSSSKEPATSQSVGLARRIPRGVNHRQHLLSSGAQQSKGNVYLDASLPGVDPPTPKSQLAAPWCPGRQPDCGGRRHE